MRRFFYYNSASFIYVYPVDVWAVPIALGFKKLSSTATLCCRVRRASDNAELDIGFVGNSCDFAAILAFAPLQECAIARIYNQGTGGSGYDVFNTTGSQQPVIIAAAATNQITEDSNGNKSPRFFGKTMNFDVKDFFNNKSIGIALSVYDNSVVTSRDIVSFSTGTAVGNGRFLVSDARTTASRHDLRSRRLDADTVATLTDTTNFATGVKQRTDIVDWGNSDAFIRRNGAQVASSTSHGTSGNTSSTDSLRAGLGLILGSINSVDSITEVLMFNTDISADLAAIEANQISRYVI
jgi:hypothetical protein